MAELKKQGRRPKQQDLIEDREITGLSKLAEKYADIRDQRQELTAEEVKLKESVREVMHKHGKKTYKFGNVEITLEDEPAQEKVVVRVVKQTGKKSGE